MDQSDSNALLMSSMHASYQSNVTMMSREEPASPERPIPRSSLMLGVWMDGSLQPAPSEASESAFYGYLRVLDDSGPRADHAADGQQPQTLSQWLLQYLGVDMDCSRHFVAGASNEIALTVEGVLDGCYSVHDLQSKGCTLALVLRMSALGLTKSEINRNPRLRNLHHWSFANYVRQRGSSVQVQHHCSATLCSRATSFQYIGSLAEMDAYWQMHVEWHAPTSHLSVDHSSNSMAAVRVFPLLPADDDPFGIALATIVLNRPALVWEALHLRQYLARHFQKAGNHVWSEQLLDLAFQDTPRLGPLALALEQLFRITIVQWWSPPQGSSLCHQVMSASHSSASSWAHVWWACNSAGKRTLVPLFQATPRDDERGGAVFCQPPKRFVHVHVDPNVVRVSDLKAKWSGLWQHARQRDLVVQPHPPLLLLGESFYAALLQRFYPLLCATELDAVEMELRQVVAHSVRLQRNHIDAEHLAFHILNPSSGPTTSSAEIQAVVDCFGIL